jgi:hypothetical protein
VPSPAPKPEEVAAPAVVPYVEVTEYPPIVGGADFPALHEIKKRPELVEGFLSVQDFLIISAPPKNAKSLIQFQLALCITAGVPFLGQKTLKSNVLIIDLELRQDVSQTRLLEAAKKLGLPGVPDGLHLWNLARQPNLDLESMIAILESRMNDLPPFGLIIVDPIYIFGTAENFSENDSASMTRLVLSLQKIAASSGAALSFSHHFRKGKAGSEESTDRMAGSGVLARYCDVAMTMSYHEQDWVSICEVTSRHYRHKGPFCVEITPPIVKRRDDLNPTRFRTYTPGSRTNNISPEGLLDLLPDEGLRRAEWLNRAVNIGVTELLFSGHVTSLRLQGKIVINDDFCRKCDSGISEVEI